MPEYRRNRVPGGTFFFTVNLLERRSDLLVWHVNVLREAVRRARLQAPFRIDAWVVLPDHMHCLWTLQKAMPTSRPLALPEGGRGFQLSRGRYRAFWSPSRS